MIVKNDTITREMLDQVNDKTRPIILDNGNGMYYQLISLVGYKSDTIKWSSKFTPAGKIARDNYIKAIVKEPQSRIEAVALGKTYYKMPNESFYRHCCNNQPKTERISRVTLSYKVPTEKAERINKLIKALLANE